MKKIFRTTLLLLILLVTATSVYIFINYTPDKSFSEVKEKWAYENSQFLELDGMPVHYRINGNGKPIVLIHGTGSSLHTWEGWTKILEQEFQVISLDIPGFGLTGPNKEGEYNLDYYAKFLDTFLKQIDIDTITVAGNSLGGAIAWTYTTLFPKKVKKLILVDASGYTSNKEPPLAFRLAKNPISSRLLLSMTPKSLFETSIKDVYYNKALVSSELINQYYELYLREGNRQAFIDRVNTEQYEDPSKIKTIKCPTLIQWGQHDHWVSLENAYKFNKDIADSKLIIYENAGHVPMEEIPEITGRDALNFLLD